MCPSEVPEAAPSAVAWGTLRPAARHWLGSGGPGGFRWGASVRGLAVLRRLWSLEHRENEVWDFGVHVESLHVQNPLQPALRY